jgi:hypothetical protein
MQETIYFSISYKFISQLTVDNFLFDGLKQKFI